MLMMLTTAIFVIAYALIMSERVPHYLVALGGAVAVLAIGAIDPVTNRPITVLRARFPFRVIGPAE